MSLTAKQKAWDEHKAAARAERATSRGVAVTHNIPLRTRPPGAAGPCRDCPHTRKHHKRTGRCRRNCPCTNGRKRRGTK